MKKYQQTKLDFEGKEYKKSNILKNIFSLIKMYKKGVLGGEFMPEDSRPDEIELDSIENYLFLTLPMALNYQRNSYKLWEGAALTFRDEETNDVFYPDKVIKMSTEELREKLTKYKLALQPNKHIEIWQRISNTIALNFEGDVRKIFSACNNDVKKLIDLVQKENKKGFPYLSGHKIFNYWLHVIEVYTPTEYSHREEITIAPDTHVIQGSLRLDLISGTFEEMSQNRYLVSDAWKEVLNGSEIAPIDVHTPLWLWSKRGFPKIQG